MNNIYIYDGGFISYIALVVELLKRKTVPDDIKLIDSYDKGLFDNEIFIRVEDEQNNIELLKTKLTKEVSYCIYNVFLHINSHLKFLLFNIEVPSGHIL